MQSQPLAIGLPGPFELIILLVILGIGLTFVFLLFRFLWRAGSIKPNSDTSPPPRSER